MLNMESPRRVRILKIHMNRVWMELGLGLGLGLGWVTDRE